MLNPNETGYTPSMFPDERGMLQRIRAHALATLPDVDVHVLDSVIDSKLQYESQQAENKIKSQIIVEMMQYQINTAYMMLAKPGPQPQEGQVDGVTLYKIGPGNIIKADWVPLEPKCTCGGAFLNGIHEPNIHKKYCPAWETKVDSPGDADADADGAPY